MINDTIPATNCSEINDYNVITMGTFDGVHIGHQELIRKVIERARKNNGRAYVITYYHHPKETFNPNLGSYLLTEKERKTKLLQDLGVDCIAYLHFDHEMSKMAAEDFIRKILHDQFKAKEIIFGYDCHFGLERKGDYKFLKSHEKTYGYKSFMVRPVLYRRRVVSSSLIRNLIREGDVERAAFFLGRNYDLHGKVEHGDKIGRVIGFPTINISPSDSMKLLPATGVYFGKVLIDHQEYFCLTNVGYSPTLKNTENKRVEGYILDYEGDLYNRSVIVEFMKKIREEKSFAAIDRLVKAIEQDVKVARQYIQDLAQIKRREDVTTEID